jgi:hypothetical protein
MIRKDILIVLSPVLRSVTEQSSLTNINENLSIFRSFQKSDTEDIEYSSPLEYIRIRINRMLMYMLANQPNFIVETR